MEGTKKFVITVARQYGSGGREIGLRLGELLGVKAYDKELITMAAQKSGMSSEVLNHVDEKASSSLLYTLAMGSSYINSAAHNMNIPISDKLFMTQSEIIREIAAEGSCVIVGRCADHVLRQEENRISIFVYAPRDFKVDRIIERHEGVDEKQAKDLSQKTDKRRINYYNYYTGKKWGSPENYHIMIDSSVLGIEGTAQALAEIIRKKYGI
ncbi:MAG: cytidylate kinase-like family protein [Clostridia bacterium]|nr:cytidylate kinase-like family protein [Clostridia bacterium]